MHNLQLDYAFEDVPCNLCGENEHEVVFPASRRGSVDLVGEFKSSADRELTEQLVACSRCGLQYVTPRLHQDLILQAYGDGTDERFVSQARAREFTFARSLRRVEKHLGPGRLLDVGTAGGSFLHVAAARGWEVAGCEPNHWMCEWGRAHYGVQIDAGTLEQQRYPDEAFDAVTLWDVLEHAGDPARLLVECRRVTRAGGLLVVNYPDVGSWAARMMGRRWVFFLSGHLYYFTRRTISELLRRTGFEVVEMRPHVQWLELEYLALRGEAVSALLSRRLRRLTGFLGLSQLLAPYWIGQTFVIARRSA
jgi:2-polyprenyl-3-methyl-5-hydroxy-6-metoxy-1,4-benzoquinol methylase